jgi:hypothetical protein
MVCSPASTNLPAGRQVPPSQQINCQQYFLRTLYPNLFSKIFLSFWLEPLFHTFPLRLIQMVYRISSFYFFPGYVHLIFVPDYLSNLHKDNFLIYSLLHIQNTNYSPASTNLPAGRQVSPSRQIYCL